MEIDDGSVASEASSSGESRGSDEPAQEREQAILFGDALEVEEKYPYGNINGRRPGVIRVTAMLRPSLLSSVNQFGHAVQEGRFQIKKISLIVFLDVPFERFHEECFQKLGKIFGCIGSLETLAITEGGGWSAVTVACHLLPHVRQIRNLELCSMLESEGDPFHLHEDRRIQAMLFAYALSGHPVLENLSFSGKYWSQKELRLLTSTLYTLPRLSEFSIYSSLSQSTWLDEETTSQIFCVKSLRKAKFCECAFQAPSFLEIGKALGSGSLLSCLSFIRCRLPDEGGASLAESLPTNTELRKLQFDECTPDSTFFGAMREGLSANVNLTELIVNHGTLEEPLRIRRESVLKFLEGLMKSQALRFVTLPCFHWDDVTRLTLLKTLAFNTSLRMVTIRCPDVETWGSFIRFLCANSSLQTLRVDNAQHLTEASLQDTANALERNSTLQRFEIHDSIIGNAAIIAFIGMLCSNSSLKHFHYRPDPYFENSPVSVPWWEMDEEEAPKLIAALKNNYGLVDLNVRVKSPLHRRLLCCALRLNQSGRRYLMQDSSSKEKGVEVLSNVSNSLDCLFLHLRENPSLCLNGPERNNASDALHVPESTVHVASSPPREDDFASQFQDAVHVHACKVCENALCWDCDINFTTCTTCQERFCMLHQSYKVKRCAGKCKQRLCNSCQEDRDVFFFSCGDCDTEYCKDCMGELQFCKICLETDTDVMLYMCKECGSLDQCHECGDLFCHEHSWEELWQCDKCEERSICSACHGAQSHDDVSCTLCTTAERGSKKAKISK